MTYCFNCGEELDDKADLCMNCGIDQTQSIEGGHDERDENQKYCVECGELIHKEAKLCPNCGVSQPSFDQSSKSESEQTVAGIFAILLGGLGVHKFYQGRIGLGVIYLCFSWTFIPAIVGFIEGILILVANEDEYYEKYADGDIFGSW